MHRVARVDDAPAREVKYRGSPPGAPASATAAIQVAQRGGGADPVDGEEKHRYVK